MSEVIGDTRAGVAASPPVWTRTRVVALAVLCLATLLDAVDITVVNVALPTIGGELGFARNDLPWVVNAYMVAFGGFLLLGGRAGDLLGARRVLVAGLGLFAAASLASGLAQSAGMLVATRAAQGLAAAMITPMALALLAAVFPAGRQRSRAIGMFGATNGISGVLGLVVGGLLVNGPGWRWIFLVNVPICVAVAIAALLCLPGGRTSREHRRFDLLGAVTVTAGCALLAYAALQTDRHPWGSAWTISLLAGAAALLGFFALHESRGRDPLLPFTVLRRRSILGASVVSALLSSAMFSLFYFTTLYQQEVLHYSALRTGLAYIALAVTLVVGATLSPSLVPRFGPRTVIACGAAVAAGGLALMTLITTDGSLVGNVILPTVVVGLGFSVIFVPITTAALAGVDPAHTGVASALLNVTRQLGGALGLAAVTTVVTARTGGLADAGAATADALTGGFRFGFTVAAGAMALAAVAAVLLFPANSKAGLYRC